MLARPLRVRGCLSLRALLRHLRIHHPAIGRLRLLFQHRTQRYRVARRQRLIYRRRTRREAVVGDQVLERPEDLVRIHDSGRQHLVKVRLRLPFSCQRHDVVNGGETADMIKGHGQGRVPLPGLDPAVVTVVPPSVTGRGDTVKRAAID